MRKMILLFCLLAVVAIAGCATVEDAGPSGGERPSGHSGHHH